MKKNANLYKIADPFMAFLSKKWFMARPGVGGAVVNDEGTPEQKNLDVVAESLRKKCLFVGECK